MTRPTPSNRHVAVQIPIVSAKELLQATELVSWKNDDFKLGTFVLEAAIKNPVTDEELFITQAEKLLYAGYTRSKLYDLLRNSLPPREREKQATARSIRDMKILRDLLRGETIKVLAERYKLPSLARSSAIANGYRRLTVEHNFDRQMSDFRSLRTQDENWQEVSGRVLAKLDELLYQEDNSEDAPKGIELTVTIETLVSDDELNEEELDIPDVVHLAVSGDTPEHLLADAALDVLHSEIAISCLDHFDFVVLRDGKPLETDENHETYSLSESGRVQAVESSNERSKRNPLAERFLNMFEASDSIEINGFFVRHYDNTVHSGSGDPQDTVIEVEVETEDGMLELSITEKDLEEIEICDEGNVWRVAGCNVEFHMVTQISTNPVMEA